MRSVHGRNTRFIKMPVLSNRKSVVRSVLFAMILIGLRKMPLDVPTKKELNKDFHQSIRMANPSSFIILDNTLIVL